MRNDGATSSRNHRERDEWRPGNDRYDRSPSKDSYRRGGRDDYGPRDTDPFGRDYPPANRQYSDGYDDDRGPQTSYMDPAPRSPAGYDDRDTAWSRWTPKDNRAGPRNDRGRGNYEFNDRYKDSGRKEENREFKERRRDNGWASRRRTNPEVSANMTPLGGFEPPTSDDRPGEPSGSWQPANGRNETQRKNKHSKKKNKHKNDKRNRDWRNDDSHLNNWQRRDGRDPGGSGGGAGGGSGSTKTPRPHRKQPYSRRSFSRSRSRSPADSYYSRRSSRGRSRSSDSVRYRRRPDSRGPRSRSPADRWSDRGGRPSRRYSPSPSLSPPRRYGRASRSPPPRRRGRSRTRTPSSPSSVSRSRSRSRSVSRSPRRDRSRTVHRLPAATSLEDARRWVEIPKSPRQNQRFPQRNGDGQPKLTKAERKALRRVERAAQAPRNAATQMPPPSVPHSESATREQVLPAAPSPARSPPRSSPARSPTRSFARSPSPVQARSAGKPKNAGFKPIGQTNPSLKRFFPGDDSDEPEPVPKRRPSSPHTSQTTVTTTTTSTTQDHFVTSTNRVQETTAVEVNVHSQQNGKHIHASRLDRIEVHSVHRPGPPHDTLSHIPTPATPSPASHHPSRHYATNDHRMQNGSAHPRSQDMVSVEPRHVQPHMHGQEPHTPSVTRPPTPRNEEFYSIVSQVGEGTFGKVYKARNTANGKFVALKRIRMEAERDGFPVTAMREIKLLQSLRHENVVRLYEMMVSNGSVFMVFEYMDHDLTGVLSQTQFTFSDAHLKSLCQQMLAGLAYLHHKGVIHRDIKGSNILVNNRGELKLADFGLARFYQKRRRSDYTNRVITLWYRPPELLFGTTVYGPEVDMWSAGCIMLELFTKKPVFQGNDEIHQLDVVYKILGTPTPERWPGVNSLPWYELVKPKDVIPNHFRELFQKWLSPAALDLAEQLLAYDPAQRATAVQALDAPYFNQEQPPAEPPTGLSTLEGEWHELETKRERAKKRRKTEGSTQ